MKYTHAVHYSSEPLYTATSSCILFIFVILSYTSDPNLLQHSALHQKGIEEELIYKPASVSKINENNMTLGGSDGNRLKENGLVNKPTNGGSPIVRLSTLGKHPSVLIVGRNYKDDDDHDDQKGVVKKESSNNNGQNNYDPHSLTIYVAEFCNTVLGKQASKLAERFRLGNKLLTLVNATGIVLREHYLSSPWMFASLLKTRIQRFLEAFKSVLMALFIDTLIYGIFFPSDGKCESYQAKQSCLTPQSKLGGNQCMWNKDANIPCTSTPPPKDIISILILSLVITILMKPMTKLVAIASKACECRPQFELWGKFWNTSSWLGSLHHASYLDYSPLAMAFVQNEKNKQKEMKNLLSQSADRQWDDGDIESNANSGVSSPQHSTKPQAPNMDQLRRQLSNVFKERHPEEDRDEFPELDVAEEDEEIVFRLIETLEEEDRIARNCFEQLYSPYEGTISHPV